MDAAQIVMGEMQRRSGFQVVELLAESVGEPRQPPHGHPTAIPALSCHDRLWSALDRADLAMRNPAP